MISIKNDGQYNEIKHLYIQSEYNPWFHRSPMLSYISSFSYPTRRGHSRFKPQFASHSDLGTKTRPPPTIFPSTMPSTAIKEISLSSFQHNGPPSLFPSTNLLSPHPPNSNPLRSSPDFPFQSQHPTIFHLVTPKPSTSRSKNGQRPLPPQEPTPQGPKTRNILPPSPTKFPSPTRLRL